MLDRTHSLRKLYDFGKRILFGRFTPTWITLPDGRVLGYAEYGDRTGVPVFHCNGSGGSRLEWPGDASMLKQIGVRFISMDRPGHGLSDPDPERRLLDWPQDVKALARHLEIKRFYVTGWSAGGAYALACAHAMPDRVRGCAILSGIAPFDCPDPYPGLNTGIAKWMQMARSVPGNILPFRQAMAQILSQKTAREIGEMLANGEAEDDRTVAARPDLMELMGRNIQEGYRQGPDGPAQDDLVINSPWRFRLEDIRVPIQIWQGEVDQNVSLVQAQFQHRLLPNSTLTVLPNTAHLFPLIRWREILTGLVGA